MEKKSSLKRIKISEINYPLPDLKDITTSKAMAIANWIIEWLNTELKSGEMKPNTLLPAKPDLAYLLGVSIGTIQNALKYVEDLGFIESKQCIGTLVKNSEDKTTWRKLRSKRDLAISAIKNYIKTNQLQEGEQLPSSRILASIIGCSSNTTRLALECLCITKILEHKFKKDSMNDSGWLVKSTDFEFENITERATLVKQIETDLKDYITKNLKIGDKMPAHSVLTQQLNASLKTIHDGLKLLIEQGILLPRRGRYGTTVIKMPDDSSFKIQKETSIFASAQDAAFYHYEKTQNHIKKMIAENYEIGAKLPSILALSKQLDLSPNTIRKAFLNLAKEGYLAFSRGRYGGTFVIDIPEIETQSFKWLAVSAQYTNVYKTTKQNTL